MSNYEDYGINNQGKRQPIKKDSGEIDFSDRQVSGSIGDSLGVGEDVRLLGSEGRIETYDMSRVRSKFGKMDENENDPIGVTIVKPGSSQSVKADGSIETSTITQTFAAIIVTGNVTVGGSVDGIDLSSWLNQALLTTSRVGFAGGIATKYEPQTGAWADPTLTSPINGDMVVVYNSTQAASRLYIYSNSGWHYILLT